MRARSRDRRSCASAAERIQQGRGTACDVDPSEQEDNEHTALPYEHCAAEEVEVLELEGDAEEERAEHLPRRGDQLQRGGGGGAITRQS